MKNLLIFLLGAAAGAVGTYYALNRRYEDRLEDEIADLEEFYEERKEAKKEASESITETSEKKEENVPKDVDGEFVPAKRETVSDEDTDKYSKIVQSKYDKPDPGELVKKAKKTKRKDPKIFMISAGAFAASDHELKTVYLYGDGIVVDEEENVVDNGYALLGGNDVIKMAEETGETTVYIRNLNEGVDYEVIMHDEDYGYFSSDSGPEDE